MPPAKGPYPSWSTPREDKFATVTKMWKNGNPHKPLETQKKMESTTMTEMTTTAHPRRNGTNATLLAPWWTKLRSIWRLKIVGFSIMMACFFWLQDHHFRFGMPVSSDGSNNHNRIGVIPQIDDGFGHDSVHSSHATNATTENAEEQQPTPAPCPFPPPSITGTRNWTLYPKKAYDGLSLLRPRKEPILMTAFPGCVPSVLFKQVKICLFVA